MNNFYFSQMFVKSSKLLAFLAILIGFGASVCILFDWKVNLDATVYKENPELTLKVNRLKESYEKTKTKISEIYKAENLAAEEIIKEEPVFPENLKKSADFVMLETALKKLNENSKLLKENVLKKFDEDIGILVKNLKTKVQDNIDEGILEKSDLLAEKKEEKSTGIFDAIDAASLSNKNEVFTEALAYMTFIIDISKKDENVKAAQSNLNRLRMFHSNLPNVVTNDAKDFDIDEDAGGLSGAERAIIKLNSIKRNIHNAFLSQWEVDVINEDLMAKAALEQEKSFQAKNKIKALITRNVFMFIAVLSFMFFVPLFLIVGADSLKAQLLLLANTEKKA